MNWHFSITKWNPWISVCFLPLLQFSTTRLSHHKTTELHSCSNYFFFLSVFLALSRVCLVIQVVVPLLSEGLELSSSYRHHCGLASTCHSPSRPRKATSKCWPGRIYRQISCGPPHRGGGDGGRCLLIKVEDNMVVVVQATGRRHRNHHHVSIRRPSGKPTTIFHPAISRSHSSDNVVRLVVIIV